MYLCSQAAEKIIRAVLTSEGKTAGIKHQLDELVDVIPDENPLKPGLRAIQGLTDYATSYRYRAPKGGSSCHPTAPHSRPRPTRCRLRWMQPCGHLASI